MSFGALEVFVSCFRSPEVFFITFHERPRYSNTAGLTNIGGKGATYNIYKSIFFVQILKVS